MIRRRDSGYQMTQCSPWLVVAIVAAAITACRAPTTPLPTAAPSPTPTRSLFLREIVVDTGAVHQTVEDVAGGNFVHRFGGVREPLDPVSSYTLENLSPLYARVSMTLEEWEPVNDDADPETFNWDRFKETAFVSGTFGFLSLMQARGGGLVASVWDVPDWMVQNPGAENALILDPAFYAEVVESMAAWLVHARDAYGVTVDYVSFNEATLGINVKLMPDEVATLVGIAGPRFEELGLETRWLLGDCHNMTVCAPYAEAIYAYEEIRPYLGPLAFHSWDARALDDALTDMADFAEANGLEVWCTEGGWEPSLWQTPEQFPTWTNALSLASVYSRVLKLSRAKVVLYWQMMGQDYQINDGNQGYPVFHILKQYAVQFPAGTRIVGTPPDRNNVYTVAGQAPDHFALQVINANLFDIPAVVTGLPNGTYAHIRSSAATVDEVVTMVAVTDGTAELELLRGSVTILTTRDP